jgi:hypothetical protein
VANGSKLNSTVYFFFGVFLGLTALVFFGDLVAFFAGLAEDTKKDCCEEPAAEKKAAKPKAKKPAAAKKLAAKPAKKATKSPKKTKAVKLFVVDCFNKKSVVAIISLKRKIDLATKVKKKWWES